VIISRPEYYCCCLRRTIFTPCDLCEANKKSNPVFVESTRSSISPLSTSRASVMSSLASRIEEVQNKSYIDGFFTGTTKGDQPFKGKFVFRVSEEEERRDYIGEFLDGNCFDSTNLLIPILTFMLILLLILLQEYLMEKVK